MAPTGGGKTAGFLGAGLLLGGATLVVSPLRSLIADMLRRLELIDLPVRIWNSDVKDSYKLETERLLRGGEWSGFIFTTPESLKGKALSSALTGRVRLAVVDEAHCVLKDRGFRVNYAWLGTTLDRIGPDRRFACTATLPGEDQEPLIRSLHLNDPHVIVLPVSRGNLSIQIVERSEWALAALLNRHAGESGIIFVSTIRTAQKLYAMLQSQGRRIGIYYGTGMSAKKKQAAQASFMAGDVPAMIATDAFLLGIDKSDLRFIAHYDYPKSIEDWTQGFGRAGRDGLPANVYGCFLNASEGRSSRQFLIDSTYPDVEDLRRVWEHLISAPFHDETQAEIGEIVLGRRGKFAGPAALTTLQRHHLARADRHPTDGRRRRYRGDGDFDQVDWTSYLAEAAATRARFDRLCELVKQPVAEIPRLIDDYFGCKGKNPPESTLSRTVRL